MEGWGEGSGAGTRSQPALPLTVHLVPLSSLLCVSGSEPISGDSNSTYFLARGSYLFPIASYPIARTPGSAEAPRAVTLGRRHRPRIFVALTPTDARSHLSGVSVACPSFLLLKSKYV